MIIETNKRNLVQRCRERLHKLEDVMGCVISQDGDIWSIDTDHQDYPRSTKEGVGTELKSLLSKIGIKSTLNCQCTTRAIEMNSNGVKWCKHNIETILSWLEEEAKKRNLPFIKFAAKQLVNLAIKRHERKS